MINLLETDRLFQCVLYVVDSNLCQKCNNTREIVRSRKLTKKSKTGLAY